MSKVLDKIVNEYTQDVEPLIKEDLENEIEHLNAKLAVLLPIEATARNTIQNDIQRLRLQVSRIERNHFLEKGLRRLSIEPLTWRHRKQVRGVHVPKLALFALNLPEMSFFYRHNLEIRPSLPETLVDCYRDIEKDMNGRSNNGRTSVRRWTKYNGGTLPDNVREIIPDAQKEFQYVYILAETEQWLAKDQNHWPRIQFDPLLVGWDGVDLWLIEQFDTTTVEAYVAREFTS